MSASQPAYFHLQEFSDIGGPLVGGRLYTYAQGTTALKTAYTDPAGAVPQTYTADGLGGQYIALNARGELSAPLYLAPGAYEIALKRVDGSTVWTRRADPTGDATAATTAAFAASSGAGLIGWIRGVVGAVATTLAKWLGWQEINAFEFMTVAQIAAYQTSDGSVDHAPALQAWVNACAASPASGGKLVGRLPPGGGRVSTTLTVPGGVVLRGSGVNSALKGWGVPVFQITGDHVVIEDMGLFGYSAAGVADPRTQEAITTNGTMAAKNNYARVARVFFQGWNRATSLSYMDGSVIDDITTVNCNYGVRYFGQCVNNVITSSRLVANAGQASVITEKDGGNSGEGLLISDTLMASGQNAIRSDGFLLLSVHNCTVDLIGSHAFQLASVINFRFSGPWTYAAGRCFNYQDPGVSTELDTSVDCSLMTTTGADSCFFMGVNNRGWRLDGSINMTSAVGSYGIHAEGGAGMVGSVRVRSITGNPDMYVNATGVQISKQAILSKGVQWNVSPVQSVVSGATTTLPNPGGSDIQRITVTGNTNCSTLNDPSTWIGKLVVLNFTGTPTWSDGAGNLRLNGNFVAAATATLTLTPDGAIWLEVCRSIN